jgi:hypothetical protein
MSAHRRRHQVKPLPLLFAAFAVALSLSTLSLAKSTFCRALSALNSSRPIGRGPGYEVYLRKQIKQEGDLTVEKTWVEFSPVKNRLKEYQPGPGHERWLSTIRENVDFALSQYPRRGWPEEYFKELRVVAEQYWKQSIYVTVRDSKGIAGTMRYISSRDPSGDANGTAVGMAPKNAVGGQWKRMVIPDKDQRWYQPWGRPPVEKGLEVNLERPVWFPRKHDPHQGEHPAFGTMALGEVMEPGNYAARKDLNAKALLEMTKHFIESVFPPQNSADYNMNGTILYSYADKEGKGLYLPMGFELVDENHPIDHAGRQWWVIRMNPEKMKAWVDKLSRRSILEEKDIQELNDLLNLFARQDQVHSKRILAEGSGHGLQSPVGYSFKPTVEAELNAANEKARVRVQQIWNEIDNGESKRLNLSPATVGHYQELYSALSQAFLKKEPVISYYDLGSFSTLRGTGERPVDTIFFYPTDSHVTMEGKYGPLWQMKVWLWNDHLAEPTGPYAGKPEFLFQDLEAAMRDELEAQSRDSESLPTDGRVMTEQLMKRFWQYRQKRVK